jgi:MoaA/NifB/PqqE/SkfB family radical SAM enzyme
MLTIEGLELTNACNLCCEYCINKDSTFPVGYASDEIVRQAIRYCKPDGLTALHGLGECLLHPQVVDYVQWFTDAGRGTYISTNGILLTPNLLNALVEAGLTNLSISLHSQESAEAFLRTARHLTDHPAPLQFDGNIMLIREQETRTWLRELGATDADYRQLRVFPTWEWMSAKNRQPFPSDVVANRKRNCVYLLSNQCSVKWDGTVVSCCLDANAVNRIGHLGEFEVLRHSVDEYNLCDFCTSNWCNNYV